MKAPEEQRDTIPAPPPSFAEDFTIPRPPPTIKFDEELFAFALDQESLEEL